MRVGDDGASHTLNEEHVLSFTAPTGTHGARQPGGLFLKVANTLAMGWIRRKRGAAAEAGMLVLTTVGAKSGAERASPLWYLTVEEGWLVVASAAGAPNNPAWYHNLAAHPDRVTIQLGGRTIPVTAEQVNGPERERVWKQVTDASQQMAKYQTLTDREIPVIRLVERAA